MPGQIFSILNQLMKMPKVAEIERRSPFSDESGGKYETGRLPSVESFTSDDFKSSNDDDGISKPMKLVQHPLGNDGSNATPDTCQKAANVEIPETCLSDNSLRDLSSFGNSIQEMSCMTDNSVRKGSTNFCISMDRRNDESNNENGPSPTPNVNTLAAKTRRCETSTGTVSAKHLPDKEKVTVFVTYAKEPQNKMHYPTIVQIVNTLHHNCIDVTVDILEETAQFKSTSYWLDKSIANNEFILICVSPSYRRVVESPSASIADFPQNESTLNTQYVYRMLHTEYIKQGSKNFRFLPVLLSGANGQHVPAWLRDTKIFEWPKGYEDIIYRLRGQEKFIKPKTGRPLTHAIEMYNCYSNQKKNNALDKDIQPTHSKRLR